MEIDLTMTKNTMKTLIDGARRRVLTANTPPTPRRHLRAQQMLPAFRS